MKWIKEADMQNVVEQLKPIAQKVLKKHKSLRDDPIIYGLIWREAKSLFGDKPKNFNVAAKKAISEKPSNDVDALIEYEKQMLIYDEPACLKNLEKATSAMLYALTINYGMSIFAYDNDICMNGRTLKMHECNGKRYVTCDRMIWLIEQMNVTRYAISNEIIEISYVNGKALRAYASNNSVFNWNAFDRNRPLEEWLNDALLKIKRSCESRIKNAQEAIDIINKIKK